jgi:hypothetical protein
MIENDLMRYLATDATLATLLGAVSGDNKIYPAFGTQQADEPFLLVSATVGTLDEILDEDRLSIKIIAKRALTVQQIRDRIKVLLDKQDGIQAALYAYSTTYFIYYCKLAGSSEPYFDDIVGEWIDNIFFAVKYKSKV